MRVSDFAIPKAIQIALDDVGWFYGRDERSIGGPARTGMPRRHVLEDYVILEELGKALDMRIHCLFVIGEWDRKGILARVPNSNRYGKNWKGSEYYDETEAMKILSYLRGSQYIELGVHGLMHDTWDENGNYLDTGEFFLPEGNVRGAPEKPVADDYLRSHLDAFFEIYDEFDLPYRPRSFSYPRNARNALAVGRPTKILAEYGIRFMANGAMLDQTGNMIERGGIRVLDGVICGARVKPLCSWEAYDIDPDDLPVRTTDLGGLSGDHWPSLLRYNPKKNLEHLDSWVSFYHRSAEVFGLMLSRDVEFAYFQQIYANLSTIQERDGGIAIDLTKADNAFPVGEKPPIYISVKKRAGPILCIGGAISKYEEKNDFTTYKIDRTDSAMLIIK